MAKDSDLRRVLFGLGLDGKDGHRRLTKGDNFCLVGGSEETHDRMTETVIHLNERLKRRGKTLNDVPPEELRLMIREASEE